MKTTAFDCLTETKSLIDLHRADGKRPDGITVVPEGAGSSSSWMRLARTPLLPHILLVPPGKQGQ